MKTSLRVLLQLVDAGADISFLLRNGYSYSQIAALFGEAMKDGLIAHLEKPSSGRRFVVTAQGLALLSDGANRKTFGSQGQWISPDDQHRCAQIAIDDVFLPSRKDAMFLRDLTPDPK